MKRSSKRLAAVAATLVLGSVGLASATMAEGGGPNSKPAPDISMDARADHHTSLEMTETSFVPVTPCRLFDTRNAGGVMTETSRNFSVKGALAGQGGKANCGIPEGATAASINLTAISQGRKSGFVRGWATGGPAATATLLNYSPALNASNSVEVPLCEGACAKDLTLRVFGSAHLIGEVLGYYIPQIHVGVDFYGDILNGSSRVLGANRIDVGLYEIDVDRNIDGCSVAASSNALGGTYARALGDQIVVKTFDYGGHLMDASFELVAAC